MVKDFGKHITSVVIINSLIHRLVVVVGIIVLSIIVCQ